MSEQFKYDDLVGLGYHRRGRGPLVYDCWGLFMEVNRRLGRHVPDFGVFACAVTQAKVEEALPYFDKVDTPGIGDGVLIRQVTGSSLHIGAVVEKGRFLHTTSAVGFSHCLSLSDPLYVSRIKGFYRVKEG